MKMKEKMLSLALTAIMATSMVACGGSQSTGSGNEAEAKKETTAASNKTEAASPEAASPEAAATEELDYTFGENETFHSNEPVSYTMFWSDHEAYPVTDTWQIFNKITERTNVTLDYKDYNCARPDYEEKKKLMINSGQSAYIIPKTYEESAFVDGGAIVAVSDWTQYMPNYTAFVEKYDMQPDLATIEKADGKYYRLPGLKERAEQDYSFVIRNDLFKAAGYDVASLEKDWTWDDLYDILVDVKEYMVKEGMCAESDYIWSERWPAEDGSGGNLVKLMGASYNVPAGWAIGEGLAFDFEKDEWYFPAITDDYKEFVTVLNKFIKGGILDPESFTQTDEVACQKFYRGETVIFGVNKAVYTTYTENLDAMVGKGNYELYITVYPKGTSEYSAENQRLENGVMIASKALDELGEEGFIKMLRFVDWLFYSDEAYTLTKWGVEGETYEVKDGVKQLLPQWYCGGLSLPQTSEDQKDMRIELGYAGGVFYYAGTIAQMTDAYTPEIRSYIEKFGQYRKNKPINPLTPRNEDENEQVNLWKTPLIDNVNSWTLQFATGVKDVNADWDEFVSSCKNLNCDEMVALQNEVYQRTK